MIKVEKNSVAAIIVSYNGGVDLLTCINLCLQEDCVSSLWIVDNASSDKETLRSLSFTEARIHSIRLKKNIGYGRANNLAIAHALCEPITHILLLNQDCFLETNTVKQLLLCINKSTNYGAVAPIELKKDGSEITQSSLNWCCDHAHLYLRQLLAGNKPDSDCVKVSLAKGACLLLSRNAVERIGGFDPVFFMYGEDDDYCKRLRYHGYDIGLCLGIFVRHEEGKSKRWMNTRQRYYLAFGSMVNLIKRPNTGLLRNLSGVFRFIIQQTCQSSLWFDYRQLLGVWWATGACLMKLPVILASKQNSWNKNAPWLCRMPVEHMEI